MQSSVINIFSLVTKLQLRYVLSVLEFINNPILIGHLTAGAVRQDKGREMQEKINYLKKDLYNVCQSIIKKKYDFIIEVNKQKDIRLLQKTLPSFIGKTDKAPSLWAMFLTAFKFSDISAIIGSVHQGKKYTISYEVKDTLLLHFKVARI